MDAFYASVEQRENPAYRGRPLVVGGKSGRGVIAAASYEARQYGIHSAMPAHQAIKRCPSLIFVEPNFELYRAISHKIREIFLHHTPLVEPLSLDEAFLDVTENRYNYRYGMEVAQTIKREIYNTLGLTASAGVSYNKFLAKIASDIRKPDGLFILHPKNAPAFVDQLPIEKFYGVGAVTAEKMHQLGIYNGRDLKSFSKEALIKHFGKVGEQYYQFARAIDHRPVNPNRIRKSVGVEETLPNNITNRGALLTLLKPLLEELIRRCRKADFIGRTFILKVKYYDFQQITRSRTVNFALGEESAPLWSLLLLLLQEIPLNKSIRLIGVAIQNIDQEKHALNNELNQSELKF